MKKEITDYLNAMAVVKSLLEKGIINKEDYKKAEEYLAQKYNVSIKSIYRSITWYFHSLEWI